MSKWLSVVFACVTLFIASAGASVETQGPAMMAAPEDSAENWQLVKKDGTMVLYERDVPGSPVIAFRGEGVLDAPIARVASVLLDNAHAPEWVDSLEESRLLRRIGPMEYIEYNHIGTPFVMKDRDFVAHVKIEIDPKAHTLALKYKSVDDPSAPATSNIRGELINSEFTLTSLEGGKKTSLRAEIHADPKGSVPKWIVNMFQRSWPRDTFKGIQKQLTKSGIPIPSEFANVISQLKF
jgi:hypothetical protein